MRARTPPSTGGVGLGLNTTHSLHTDPEPLGPSPHMVLRGAESSMCSLQSRLSKEATAGAALTSGPSSCVWPELFSSTKTPA